MNNTFPTEWDLYEYIINVDIELQNTNKKDTINLNKFQILGLMMEKNFDEDMFPILLIDLLIPRSVYYKIIKNENPKIILNIDKYIKSDNAITHRETMLREKFTPVVSDDSGDINADLYKNMKAAEEKKDDDISSSDMNSVYQFILVLSDDIVKSKTITNTVLSNVNVSSVLAYLIFKSGFGSNNILMSPVDNNTTYSETLLLPIPLVDQFDYISNTYGIYREGLQLFKDFDILYILRKTGKCTTYQKNEITTITFAVVGKIGGYSSISRGISYDTSNNRIFMNVSGNQLSISDTSSIVDKTSGLNTQIIQVETGDVVDVIGSNNSTSSIMTTTSHNKYIKDEMTLRKKELSHIINLTIDDIDISLLTPNKEYKFITNVSDMRDNLSGTYRICSVRSVFKKEGINFKCMTSAMFKRTSDK